MDLKKVNTVVSKLQASIFKNSNSFSIGMLKSHFRGTGLQFKEHQVYNYGDDVRFIDWSILAKTGNPYIKTFEEERNLEIVVIIDASPSMYIGHKGISKLQAAIEITCLLYLLARKTNDYVHAIIVTDSVYNTPPKSGEEGVSHLVSLLESINILDEKGNIIPPKIEEINLEKKLDISILLKHLEKKREVVILSDLVQLFTHDFFLKIIKRKHVHCFQLMAPLDETKKLPYSFLGVSSSDKNKAGYHQLDTSYRNDYRKLMASNLRRLRIKDRYLEEFVKEML